MPGILLFCGFHDKLFLIIISTQPLVLPSEINLRLKAAIPRWDSTPAESLLQMPEDGRTPIEWLRLRSRPNRPIKTRGEIRHSEIVVGIISISAGEIRGDGQPVGEIGRGLNR